MPANTKMFCDCQKCTCKNCPDILKNLNITVTKSQCYFNKTKEIASCCTTKLPHSSKCAKVPQKGVGPSKDPLIAETNKTSHPVINEALQKQTGIECLDCGIVARAMKAQEPLTVGLQCNQNVKKMINKMKAGTTAQPNANATTCMKKNAIMKKTILQNRK